MIFAEMRYKQHYSDFHVELVDFIRSNFSDIQYGLQGDSWIWIFDEDEKVAIDTFSSMKHQVKCNSERSQLLKRVISNLSAKFELDVYEKPELEAHEDL